MNRIGIIPNPEKPEAMRLANKIARWLRSKNYQCFTPDLSPNLGIADSSIASEDEISKLDLIIILGGDGTILKWAKLAGPHETPLLGINFGKYGFITEIQPNDAIEYLENVLSGQYFISERVALKTTIKRNNFPAECYYALNDVVASKGIHSRMLALRMAINDKFIATHHADGIIVASPTGSTAYSLSAGGSVVHPDIRALVITPICPHTLNARSIVIPDKDQIEIIIEPGLDTEMLLSIDGQHVEALGNKDKIIVEKAEYTVKLIQMQPDSFYDKLQSRLRWGERFN